MEFTPVQNLPCLGPDDYAHYALYMQCLAEQLEDNFTAKNNALLGVRRNYAAMWRNTVAIVSDGGGAFPGMTAIPNLFWNDPNNTPTAGIVGSLTDPFRYQFPGMVNGGLYEVGGTIAFNAGVTANSSRQFQINGYFRLTSGFTVGSLVDDVTEESLSLGEFLRGDYQIRLVDNEPVPGTAQSGRPLGFTINPSEGDAGAITIPIGGLTFWAVYIGSNTLIGGI